MTNHLRRVGVVLALTSLAIGSQCAAGQEETVGAAWMVREMNFNYRSSVAMFTCSALKERVVVILRAIGAREDMDVRVDSCEPIAVSHGLHAGAWGDTPDASFPSNRESDPFERNSDPFGRATQNSLPSNRFGSRHGTGLNGTEDQEQSAHVRARFVFPSVVTPEVLAELDKEKSRRELISRMTGNTAALQNSPVIFPAKRQLITLSHETIGISPTECQLLEQMSGFFKGIDVKVVKRSTPCSRSGASRTPLQMTVESLVGVPLGMGSVPTWPPLSAGDADPPSAAPTPPTPAPTKQGS